MIHLYALLDAAAEVPPVQGLDDAQVEARRVDGVTAVVSALTRPVEASAQAAVRHGSVVDAVAARNDAVLPARFGTAFADEDALAAAVVSRSDELRTRLEHVRGCVELGVRARWDAEPAGETAEPPTTGREYLRARYARYARARELADRVHPPLAELSRDTRRVDGLATGGSVRAAYLVPDDAVDAFRARVEALERAHPGITLVCTGPWPPYSFATLGERHR
jgi:Gas vesicle synthesis protein GvpL/GvpF